MASQRKPASHFHAASIAGTKLVFFTSDFNEYGCRLGTTCGEARGKR